MEAKGRYKRVGAKVESTTNVVQMCVKACSAAGLSCKKRGIRAALMNVKIPTPHASLLGEAAGLGMSRVPTIACVCPDPPLPLSTSQRFTQQWLK